MGTVSSSLNPGVADLLQTLTNVNSPIVNSAATVSALEKAPASDIVQLSEEALQLQGVDALFGGATTAPSNIDTLFGIPATTSTANPVIQALENSGASLTPAEQAANDQATSQAAITQGLFGNTATAGQLGLLLNTLG
jgi:hypothetical protein